ncbi:hypothetical protein CA54_45990 [Symmachiella macrocystis]|uniref:Uncharacterized protein n=1 Tax=Symmachiella macrocystis TaxID=2527985 RepID=A0A5C6BBK1_9PLAN|nr:hypothetical protein CA54_45990 [Symmachiella macrocystis]
MGRWWSRFWREGIHHGVTEGTEEKGRKEWPVASGQWGGGEPFSLVDGLRYQFPSFPNSVWERIFTKLRFAGIVAAIPRLANVA